MYTVDMQTKVGVHYHIKVGPEQVRLFDYITYAGPYVDTIIEDMDEAHQTLINLIEEQLPDYLDEDDLYESYEYIEDMTEGINRGEMFSADMAVEQFGLEFQLTICSKCVPKGMN